MRMIARALLGFVLLLGVPAWADDISNGSYSTTDGGNNAAPPNGWPAGMFPNQVEPSARSNMGAVARWWERANAKLTSTGSAGAYVITPTNTSYPTAYTQGEIYCAKANFSSLGNDTLNYNGLGAKPIYVQGLSSIGKITANTILIGAQFCVAYDGALNSAAGGFQLLSAVYPAGLGTAAFQPVSAFDAAGAAATAQSTAISTASADATSKANTAQSNAISAAATDATTKANAAQSAAISTASSDATSKANTAQSNAETYAAGVASSAQSAAISSANSNTSSVVGALPNGSRTTITVSTSGPSGSGNNGDLWIQY